MIDISILIHLLHEKRERSQGDRGREREFVFACDEKEASMRKTSKVINTNVKRI